MTAATIKEKEAVLEQAVAEVVADMRAKALTVEQINAAHDRAETELQIPEWGGFVKLRSLSYDELAVARVQSWDPKKRETNEDLLNAWCLALGLIEPKIDYEVAKQWIIERSFGPVNMILSEILARSGVGRRAQEEAKSAPSE